MRLPEDIRSQVNKFLLVHAFADYDNLVAKLAEWGYEIAKSSLQRYGVKYQQEINEERESAELCKALIEVCKDDEAALAEGVTRLVYNKALRALLKINIEEAEIPASAITYIGNMIAALNKSSVHLKKYQSDARKRLEEKFKQLEAEAAKAEKDGEETAGRKIDKETLGRKIDKETLRIVREDVYGIL
jgi:hypothetical protein